MTVSDVPLRLPKGLLTGKSKTMNQFGWETVTDNACDPCVCEIKGCNAQGTLLVSIDHPNAYREGTICCLLHLSDIAALSTIRGIYRFRSERHNESIELEIHVEYEGDVNEKMPRRRHAEEELEVKSKYLKPRRQK